MALDTGGTLQAANLLKAEIVARLDAVTLEDVRDVGERMLAGPRALASVGARLALAA